MTTKHLANFFGDNQLQLRFERAEQTLQDLAQPITAGAYALPGIRLAKSKTLDVLGRPLEIGPKLDIQLEMLAESTELRLFPAEGAYAAPDKRPWAKLELSTGLDLSNESDFPAGPLAVELNAQAGAAFAYRLLLPGRLGDKRRTALGRVVRTSRLPSQLEIGDVVPGEAHRWNRTYYFDLGLKAQYGQAFDIDEVVETFKGLPIELKAHVEATISASLGFGLYDAMTLNVARVVESDAKGGGAQNKETQSKETQSKSPKGKDTRNNWVRLRLERQRKKELTLGARVALQATYDFGGSSLIHILDEALRTSAAQQVLDALADVRRYTAPAGEGEWAQIKLNLENRTKRTLQKLFDEAVDIDDWVDDTPEVREVLSIAKTIVDAYEAVGDTVRSWWSDLLGQAHLGTDSKLRQKLEVLASLDSQSFLADQLADIPVELAESLTGESLDPMMDSLQIREVISRGSSLAQEALDFLDKLANAPNQFLRHFEALSNSTGIDKAVKTLSRFDTPQELKTALEGKKDQWLQSLAERLTGKVWGKIKLDELKKISTWAKKLDDYLARAQQLPDQIRTALDELRGDFDLSLGAFFQRTTSTSSVIDIIFDPQDNRLRQAIEVALDERDAKKILSRLPDSDFDRDSGDRPYEILESVFTRRYTATGTFSLLLKFLGKTFSRKVINQRTAASTIESRQGNRNGTYLGGFERSLVHDAFSFQAGSWLEASGTSDQLELDDPYDTVKLSLSLGMARTDIAITPNVISGYQDLLADCDLDADGPDIQQVLSEKIGHQTRFSLRLILPCTADDLFPGDLTEEEWRHLYATAARRWFRDDLTADCRVGSLGGGRSVEKGEVLAEQVMSSEVQRFTAGHLYPSAGLRGPNFKDWIFDRRFTIETADETVKLPGRLFHLPLSSVIWHRDIGFKQVGKIRERLHEIDNHAPEDLRRLVLRTSKAFQKTCAGQWDNPMFNFWLLKELMRRQSAKKSLSGSRGLAQLRTRENKNHPWETPKLAGQPAQWRLELDDFES